MACAKSHNVKRWTICAVVCLFALFTMTQTAFAEDGSEVYFPAYEIENLQDGLSCLIGAVGEDGRVALMTSDVRDKKQLWAIESTQDAQRGIASPSAKCVWLLQSNDDGTYNIQTSEGKYLNTADGAALSLDTKSKSRWNIAPSDMGFVISAVATPDRSLGLYAWQKELFFANYKHSANATPTLQIFVPKTALPGAEIVWPEPDSEVLLSVGGLSASVSPEGLSVVAATGCRLSDGSMIVPQGASTFVCRYVGDSVFVLQNDEGYFSHSLAYAETPEYWSVDAVGLKACDATGVEISEPYLVYNKTISEFCLIPASEVWRASYVPAMLSGCAPEATEELSEEGVKTLRGGWSTEALSAVSWQGVSALDLRALALPTATQAFVHRPLQCNSPILVNAEASMHLVKDWPFVLQCDGEDAQLLSPFTLSDGVPLKWGGSFCAPEGILSYARQMHADGGWETLCVPFATMVPDGFEVRVPGEISENEITFQKVERLEANQAAIVRYVGAVETGSALLHLNNDAETVQPASSDFLLRGLYDTLRVEGNESGIYLLNTSGQAFVRAASGSWVAPFRAWLCPGQDADVRTAYALRLPEDETSGCAMPVCDANRWQGACYDLQGRCVLLHTDAASFAELPAGVYIVNGKIIIKQ